MKKMESHKVKFWILTELAAVATVGDVMDLREKNRIHRKRRSETAFGDTYTGDFGALIPCE